MDFDTAPVHLNIATLPLAIHSASQRITDTARLRYAAFCGAPDSRPLLRLDITLDAAFVPPPLAHPQHEEMAYDAAQGRLLTASSQTFFDLEAGSARMQLSERQPDIDIEYSLRMACALLALRQGGLLLHTAAVARHGQAVLFFGPSGSGKTTVARLSPHDTVLNDDLVLVLPTPAGWTVYATPFWNPTQVRPAGNYNAPLTALLRLVQAPAVSLEAADPACALADVLASVPVVVNSVAHGAQALAIVSRLLQTIPVYRLRFLPDDSFWQVVEPLLTPPEQGMLPTRRPDGFDLQAHGAIDTSTYPE